jgi:hypothetical protein
LVAFIVMYFATSYALFVTIVGPLRDLAIAAKTQASRRTAE